jgi:hypothetical protein
MKRSANMELILRINEALLLMRQMHTPTQVATALMDRHGVSMRQAYRYIKQAEKAKDLLPVPEQKEVFTVKLPKSLVYQLRELARLQGTTLSLLVTQALMAFLKREGHG